MVVNKVKKNLRMDKELIVRFQILTYCYLNDINISKAELECFALLAIVGQTDMKSFCEYIAEKKIFTSSQVVRNSLNFHEKTDEPKSKLIVKEGNFRKKVGINPDIPIVTEGNILLDYTFLYHESN